MDKKRVLIVDDEETITSALEMLLEDEYEIRPFTTHSCGINTMDWIKDREQNIDFAVLDILINGISGIDIAHELMKTNPDIPIMFITGCSPDSVEFDKAKKIANENDNINFCTKPFDENEVKFSTRIIDELRNQFGG